jgi:hypothetical protein
MASMNTGRIVTGGLAAGLVMNVIDFLVNGVWLGARWQRQTEILNAQLAASPPATSMAGWVAYDFLMGIATVWLYAAIRPRLGPGPRTALCAGFFAWLVSHLAFASYWFGGMFTWRLVAASSAGGLVAALAGAYLGGMLYKEAEA